MGKYIKDQLMIKTDKVGKDIAFQIAKTTLSSKIFGRESDFFANMAVDAMNMVKEVNPETGKTVYPVKSVGIIKQHGGSAKDSALFNGYVLFGGRAAQGMPRVVKNAKIALLDIDLRKKDDLRRIAKLTGGTLMITMADMEGNESFDPSLLGTADEVVEERIADDDHIIIRGGKTQKCCSVLLRGANMHMLDEIDRSLHDALCAVKRALESAAVVPGGGCVESALSIYLENFATTLGSREQLAIAEFAESLLVIPKQLAVNAAQDATDIVAKLRAHHNASQTDASKADLRRTGLDCVSGKVQNNLEAGIVEPALSKVKMIQFATEAAITVLRIDDMIKLDPEEQQQ